MKEDEEEDVGEVEAEVGRGGENGAGNVEFRGRGRPSFRGRGGLSSLGGSGEFRGRGRGEVGGEFRGIRDVVEVEAGSIRQFLSNSNCGGFLKV